MERFGGRTSVQKRIRTVRTLSSCRFGPFGVERIRFPVLEGFRSGVQRHGSRLPPQRRRTPGRRSIHFPQSRRGRLHHLQPLLRLGQRRSRGSRRGVHLILGAEIQTDGRENVRGRPVTVVDRRDVDVERILVDGALVVEVEIVRTAVGQLGQSLAQLLA